jgi:hypothetical protein
MQLEAVYDVLNARPHERPELQLTGDHWTAYRHGYEHGLIIALRAMDLAEARWKLWDQTRRLELKRRREGRRDGR